jgi:hypothetical protein
VKNASLAEVYKLVSLVESKYATKSETGMLKRRMDTGSQTMLSHEAIWTGLAARSSSPLYYGYTQANLVLAKIVVDQTLTVPAKELNVAAQAVCDRERSIELH